MRVLTGTVRGGKIAVDGFVDEGATVTVLASDEHEVFTLTDTEEAALLQAVEEADRGDFVDGDEFLRNFPSHK